MKRRKVAMLMAVLMTASSLSGSYVSAASIEDMEVTAEEIAVQSQETESEAGSQLGRCNRSLCHIEFLTCDKLAHGGLSHEQQGG